MRTEETHVWWHVVYFLNDTWSNLGDMHVNKKTVVCINLIELLWSQLIGIDVVLNIAMLMWQDNIWVSMMVTWCLKVNNFQVLFLFIGVKTEEKACIGCNFTISLFLKLTKFFFAQLVSETEFICFLFEKLSNLIFNFCNFIMISFFWVDQFTKVGCSSLLVIKHTKVFSISFLESSLF
jgi:hypothetical protein